VAKASEHGKLIASAAKEPLKPLGFKRIGQSRLYAADEGFWLNLVYFQPHRWTSGTHIRVGAHWLWHPTAWMTMDHSTDVSSPEFGRFLPFLSAAQFTPKIDAFAALAAEAVQDMRRDIASFSNFASRLIQQCDAVSSAGRPGGWPSIHAGVAAGLAGDTDAAHRMFASFDRRSDAVQGITYITVTHNRTLDGHIRQSTNRTGSQKPKP
jgi:hypothetical protein